MRPSVGTHDLDVDRARRTEHDDDALARVASREPRRRESVGFDGERVRTAALERDLEPAVGVARRPGDDARAVVLLEIEVVPAAREAALRAQPRAGDGRAGLVDDAAVEVALAVDPARIDDASGSMSVGAAATTRAADSSGEIVAADVDAFVSGAAAASGASTSSEPSRLCRRKPAIAASTRAAAAASASLVEVVIT